MTNLKLKELKEINGGYRCDMSDGDCLSQIPSYYLGR